MDNPYYYEQSMKYIEDFYHRYGNTGGEAQIHPSESEEDFSRNLEE